jgi:hypothetical protein
VPHAYKFSIQEAEAGELQIQDQPRLHSEFKLSLKKDALKISFSLISVSWLKKNPPVSIIHM